MRDRRQITEALFAGVTRGALALCLLVLAFLLGAITYKGLGAIDFAFLTTPARDFGREGGILYQIAGSILMVAVSALIVTPVALGTAVARVEYWRGSKMMERLDTALFVLNAVPSITFGLFGLILLVNVLGLGISWPVGSIVLAMMMLPLVTLTLVQALQAVPKSYRENALALGLDRGTMVRRVLWPNARYGLVTGLLLGLARAIGETAPIMFVATAFSGVGLPSGPSDPVSTLPTHILALAQQATDPQALQNAWGASFTLILIVAGLSGLAFWTRRRSL